MWQAEILSVDQVLDRIDQLGFIDKTDDLIEISLELIKDHVHEPADFRTEVALGAEIDGGRDQDQQMISTRISSSSPKAATAALMVVTFVM